jgi:glycosyltransferase involved in cell wall biosynthesis
MKVGIDSRSATMHEGSGIGTYTKNLVSNLLNNIDSNFDLIWTGTYDKTLVNKNGNIFYASGKHGLFYEHNYIPNLLQKQGIDLYHIPQNGIGFPFYWDINVVVTIHDLIPYIMPETVGNSYLERFLKDIPNIVSATKGIITVSDYSKKDILRFFPKYPAEKIFVTPLAANDNFKPLPNSECKKYLKNNYHINDPFILYLGGFSSRKNALGLIKAFHNISKDLKKSHKLILGGSLKDEGLLLKQYVHSNGLDNSVIFTGYLDEKVLPIFYNACEAFIYPSLYEGFGLPPLEAMSCRTPVITSNATSIPEVTLDSAILIDPLNIDELSYSILTLLNNEDLKQEFSEKGYKRSLQFSWKQTALKTFNSYKKICETFN